MGECELRPERLNFQSLYKQERYADVEFEVGPPGGQTWGLKAHRRVLAACSPVLKRMLFGDWVHKKGLPIQIVDIEPRAFECLIRYAYGHPCEFSSVQTALSTLCVAHKYLCPGLEWECAAFLNQQVQLRSDFALEVFHTTSFYCQTKEVLEPTAPPAEEVDHTTEDHEGSRLMDSPRRQSLMAIEGVRRSHSDWNVAMGEASMRLRHNCLQTIDQHADDVLSLEQFEDLDRDCVLSIIGRDTFAVSSEVSVFIAAERWAECECKRRKLPHASEHLREALGGAATICAGKVARLLLLSPQEFADGPVRSPLLTAEEQKGLLVHLVGNSPTLRPAVGHGDIDWAQLARPRLPSAPQYLPINAAGRCGSSDPGSPCKAAKKSKCWRWPWWPSRAKKPAKPPKQPKSKPKEQQEQREKPVCCSSTCDYLIILIACLFD